MQVDLISNSVRSFDSSFLTTNSYRHAAMRQPDITKTILHTFGQKYVMTLLTEGMGKSFSHSERSPLQMPKTEITHSNSVKWFLMGHNGKLVKVVTPPNHDGTNCVPFVITLEDAYLNLNDIARFPSGTQAIVKDKTYTPIGYVYSMQLLNRTEKLTASVDITGDMQLALGHNLVGENSAQGYGHTWYPDARENWMSTYRKGKGITGHALADKFWLGSKEAMKKGKNKGDGFIWWYEAEYQLMCEWWKMKEYFYWHATRTMNQNGTSDIFDLNGSPIIAGDGIEAQIAESPRFQYTPGTTDFDFWREVLIVLSRSADNYSDRQWMIVGGSELINEFDRAMREYTQSNNIVSSNVITDVNGNEITVKGWYRKLKGIFNNELTIVYHPMFDDPTLYGNSRHNITQLPMQSYKGYILDMSTYDGIPNISVIKRQNELVNRDFVMKEISGMVSLNGDSMQAATSYDSTRIEYLEESMIVVRNPFSNGIIEAIQS